MAMVPTRYVNRGTDLNLLTVDQLLAVHGPTPTKKRIPLRPMGPPRSKEEVAGVAAAERAYAQHQPDDRPVTYADLQRGREALREAASYPATVEVAPPSGRPKARLKPRLVSPTDPSYQGPWQAEPCRAVVELEIEVEDVGIVVYPVECEILGDHPNQPHCAEIYGQLPDADRISKPAQKVFVGWGDRE